VGVQEVDELLGGLGRDRVEVHIRDEQARHAQFGGGAPDGGTPDGGGAPSEEGITAGFTTEGPDEGVPSSFSSSTFWMTTGFIGALDLNGPIDPVATTEILSSTSMPSVTRPNTA